MLKLSDLRPNQGGRQRRKRVGRGYGSGHGGHESGRGTKGQNSRSGGGTRPGYEGGQTPFWMRFPKRGFNNPTRVEYAVVNVGQLDDRFQAGDTVTLEVLCARGVVKDRKAGLKVLGEGELTKALTVKAAKFSRQAREKILAAGGQVEEA
ncbi:MAG: 50S ribosomal protein L15 [Candidatus Bipolaricaulaceae bacterium]